MNLTTHDFYFFMTIIRKLTFHCIYDIILQVKGSNVVDVGIDLKEFYLSVEWDILAVPAFRNEEYYTSTAEQEEGEFQTLTDCSFSVIELIFEPLLLKLF